MRVVLEQIQESRSADNRYQLESAGVRKACHRFVELLDCPASGCLDRVRVHPKLRGNRLICFFVDRGFVEDLSLGFG